MAPAFYLFFNDLPNLDLKTSLLQDMIYSSLSLVPNSGLHRKQAFSARLLNSIDVKKPRFLSQVCLTSELTLFLLHSIMKELLLLFGIKNHCPPIQYKVAVFLTQCLFSSLIDLVTENVHIPSLHQDDFLSLKPQGGQAVCLGFAICLFQLLP